jgi:hypothetical protein
MLPPSLPLWLVGLGALLAWPRLRERRWLGITFVAVLLFLLLQKSKPYYLYPAFLPLFAAGAVAWEALSSGPRWRWFRPVWVVSVALGAVFAAPMAIPVLSPDRLAAYQRRIGITPGNAERSAIAELSQHFADRFGWEGITRTVHRVWAALPAAERDSCLIVTGNYGEAGALLYFGRDLGVPPAASRHNSFHLWGPGRDEVAVVIALGIREQDLREVFDEVTEAARTPDGEWSMPYERALPVWVCRGWKVPLAEAWAGSKLYI